MSDDFIHNFDPPKPPRPEFRAALYQRITQPMETTMRTRVLRAATLSFAVVALIATVLVVSPSARAFADSILQRFGVAGYTFIRGTSRPPVNPAEEARARAYGKPALQPANDAAAASQLAGFTVLGPSYLPDGYAAEGQPREWTVSDDIDGMTARVTYINQAAADHLTISEQEIRPGEPNTVLSRPEIEAVTVRGQAGAWMPADGGKNLLAWEEDGITYTIVSNTLSEDEVLKIAESLGH